MAQDPLLNDRRAAREHYGLPLRVHLSPGKYRRVVSAVDGDKFIGPPSAPRFVLHQSMRALTASWSLMGTGAADPDARSERVAIQLSGAGQPLPLATLDSGEPLDCSNESELWQPDRRTATRFIFSLAKQVRVLLVSVVLRRTPPPLSPWSASLDGPTVPVPLAVLGLPGRTLQPRTQVYALLRCGLDANRDASAHGRATPDVGGELALCSSDWSFDINVPLFVPTELGATGRSNTGIERRGV